MSHFIPPFIPAGIDHVVIWVGDLEKAKRWYTSVLGCRPAFEYPELDMVHMWHGPVIVGLWQVNSPKAAYAAPKVSGGQNVHHIAFAWQGATEAAVRKHLADCEVTIIREVRQVGARGNGLALYFDDPWGNRVELKGPPKFEPPEVLVEYGA